MESVIKVYFFNDSIPRNKVWRLTFKDTIPCVLITHMNFIERENEREEEWKKERYELRHKETERENKTLSFEQPQTDIQRRT